MKINHITNLESVTKSVNRSASVKQSKNSIDLTDFTLTKTFQATLKGQPEVRSEKLSNAKEKTSSLIYPPEELIKGISRLIAEQMMLSQK